MVEPAVAVVAVAALDIISKVASVAADCVSAEIVDAADLIYEPLKFNQKKQCTKWIASTGSPIVVLGTFTFQRGIQIRASFSLM